MVYRSFWVPIRALILLTALALAACDSAEERAEAHYQRAVSLLAEGDADRAMVEFRNVFRLNGDHSAARSEYARLLVDRGQLQEAFAQYLRLVEQDWKNAEGHRRLTELALTIGDFGAARTHADAAYELDPQNPESRAFRAAVDFRDGKVEPAVEMARGVLAEAPGNVAANMVLIAERIQAGDSPTALALIATAQDHAPNDESLALAKLGALEQMGDSAAVGAQLRAMAETFPDNTGVRMALIRWYVGAGDTDAAEAMLRADVAAAPDDLARRLTVVRFLQEMRGSDAARAELDRLVADATATGGDTAPFRRALAGLDLAEGQTERAVATLEDILATTEPSDTRRDTQVVLAGVRDTLGDAAGRDELLETVLAEDPGHVAALKLRARILIDGDRPEEAIQALRTALSQAPDDADVLTLMADAHAREGAQDLAGERLALAVEASGRAAPESIRYARFLIQDDRLGPAEGVIVDALRLAPDNRDLLLALGQIHVARGDWTRADQIAGLLKQQDDPEARQMATALEADVMHNQDRYDETIALLQTLAGERGGNTAALAEVVETYLQADNLAGARSYVDGIIAADPKNAPARTMQAGLMAVAGATGEAETAYRAILAEMPNYVPAYRALFGLLASEDRSDDAAAVLETGLAATGQAPDLLFVKAGLLETRDDFEGAIAIYEQLYAANSASPLIANNLASLISAHRDDEASLERAFAVGRRLRGTEVPAFQDTYGWILSRRGDHAEALTYLEPAAAALTSDPLVQFHLGVTQFRLDRRAEARASLERAIAIAGPDSPLPQIAAARTLLSEIESAAPAQE